MATVADSTVADSTVAALDVPRERHQKFERLKKGTVRGRGPVTCSRMNTAATALL